jgi:hypothetical protein
MTGPIAVWVFGLSASALAGGLVGSRLEPLYSNDGDLWGALVAMFTFACLRLWLAAKGSTTVLDEQSYPR